MQCFNLIFISKPCVILVNMLKPRSAVASRVAHEGNSGPLASPLSVSCDVDILARPFFPRIFFFHSHLFSQSSLTHLSLISHPFPTHNHLSPIFQPPLAFFSPSPSVTMPPPPRIFRHIAVCVILSRFILHWRQSSVSKPISRVK